MAKGSAPVSRLSSEYNPNTLKKELDRISRAVNRISAQNEDIDNRISREILSVRKSVDVAAQFSKLAYWTEWYEEVVGGVLYIVAKLAFQSGWGAVADVQYRYGDFGNIDINESWKGLESVGTSVEWIEDPGTEERNYPQGGYYRLRFIPDGAGVRERKFSTQVQLRAVDRGNGVLLQESNTFDIDKLPDVMSLSLRVGTYDGSQWPVYATGQCDLDSLSVRIGARSSIGTVNAISTGTITSITFSALSYDLYDDDLISIGGVNFYVDGGSYSAGSGVTVSVDDGAGSGVTVSTAIGAGTAVYADWSSNDSNLSSPGDFSTAVQNLTASNKNFDVLIGMFDSGVPVFAIALAYNELSGAGNSIDRLYQRATITTPQPEYEFDINTEIGSGDITASMLASSAQRAAISVSFAHKGTGSSDEDFLTYSGSIGWADGTTYSVSSTSFPETSEPTAGLWYIFHDPDTIADNNSTYNNITYAQRTTKLQLTSSAATASQPTGRRIMVGIYSPGKVTGEAAFFVSNTTVSITAPYIYAASLQAIEARMGRLEAGTSGMRLGDLVDPALTYNGIWVDTYNYWYDTGALRVGGANEYLNWDGSSLNINGNITLDKYTTGITVNYDSGSFGSVFFKMRDDNIIGDVAAIASGSPGSITFNTLNRDIYSGSNIIVGSDTFVATADANSGSSVSVTVTGSSSGHSSGETAYLDSAAGKNVFSIETRISSVYLESYSFVEGSNNRGPLVISSGGAVVMWPAALRGGLWNLSSPGVGISSHLTVGQTFPSLSDAGGYTLYSDGSAKVAGEFDATGQVNFSSLPTSSAGLSTGDLWNDAGTVKIV